MYTGFLRTRYFMLLDPDARQAVRCRALREACQESEVRGPDVRGGGYLPKRKAQVRWGAAESHGGAMTMTLLHPVLELKSAQRLKYNVYLPMSC